MARLARVVVPGLPHHVTQRGNRRQTTFFRHGDYEAYLELMAEWCGRCGVEVWSYCLMPNHVHLIAVPQAEESLRRAIGEAHRRYTRGVNFREGWRGWLWQGRFASFVMDEGHLRAAALYVAQNPVRAGLAERAEDYPWSSAAAHLGRRADRLVRRPDRLLADVADFARPLAEALGAETADLLRRHARTGRPLGNEAFLRGLEEHPQRPLLPGKAGRKPKSAGK
jgi:putative transposase